MGAHPIVGLGARHNELLAAIQTFPARWSRPTIAAVATLHERRTVWGWCQALDAFERHFYPILNP